MSEKQSKILSYDEIMSMFAEGARRHEELDRQMKETDRRLKEVTESIDKLYKQTGSLENNVGFHAEQFFQDAFAQTLVFGGEKYDRIHRNLEASDKKSGVELDIVLTNGKSVAIIEAKNRIHPDDVKKLVEEKITKFRDFFPHYKNHKVYLGIAGFSFNKAVSEKAQKYGIGIIRQVGEAIEVEAGHLTAY
jgi:hypothetical protein